MVLWQNAQNRGACRDHRAIGLATLLDIRSTSIWPRIHAGTRPRRLWPEAQARVRDYHAGGSRRAQSRRSAVVQTMRVIIRTAAMPLVLALTG